MCFMAEHTESFTMAPHLIKLCKATAKDPKVLEDLKLDRLSASIKTRLGTAQVFLKNTVKNLQESYFSLNIDEAASNSKCKVLGILVSYFSQQEKSVVIEHLGSISLIRCTAISVFNGVDSIFAENKIPYSNMMSVLLDSCNVMRGKKAGLETLIRTDRAPHLLNIDGDICHHIHNATGVFCKPFKRWLEDLMAAIFHDFYWSTELREALKNICKWLGIKYTAPERFIFHRWLSGFDVAAGIIRMFDVYKLFYYSFMKPEDQGLYREVMLEIFKRNNTSLKCRLAIMDTQKTLQMKLKTMKAKGKKRKKLASERFIVYEVKTNFILEFYVSTLERMKEYVCLFQRKSPLVHKMHSMQVTLFKDFLTCFVKFDIFQNMSSSDLKNKLNLKDKSIHLPQKEMLLKVETCDKTLLDLAEKAYSDCAIYLQNKLPLDSELLESASALDPSKRGKPETVRLLRNLPEKATNVLSHREKWLYEVEVRRYNVSIDLPVHYYKDENGTKIPYELDIWWAKVHESQKFPILTKMAMAVMSIFHGPAVEGSFNTMGDIINPKSASMKIPTYSAIQTIKYGLRARKMTSIELFETEEIKQGTNRAFCKSVMSARTRYGAELKQKKEAEKKKLEEMDAKQNKLLSKIQAKKILVKAGKDAFVKHKNAIQEKMKQTKKKKYEERLLKLVEAKKAKSR